MSFFKKWGRLFGNAAADIPPFELPDFASDPSLWRGDAALAGNFSRPEFPDELQVLVHEGGPRTATFEPELVWVRATGRAGDLFQGMLLDAPVALRNVAQGDLILFLVGTGGPHPQQVSPRYLAERKLWEIGACSQCGCHELLDAPSDLIRATYNLPLDKAQAMAVFSTFCWICGGVQVLRWRGK